jgi:hypothetical protein
MSQLPRDRFRNAAYYLGIAWEDLRLTWQDLKAAWWEWRR